MIASLQAGMPARVAAFNADPSNLVDIVTPATYTLGVIDAHAANPFPQLEAAAVEGTFGEWSVGRAEVNHDPRVNVVIWLQGVTGEIAPVYEQMLGMIACVIEVLRAPDACGAEVEIANDQGIYWRLSELIPLEMDSPEREIRTWLVPGFLQFRLEKVEHFS